MMRKLGFPGIFCLVMVILVMTAGNAFAIVILNSAAADIIVPAERTTQIGAANDGEVPLAGGAITWTSGNAYNAADRMRMTLPHAAGGAAQFVGAYKFGHTSAAATFNVLNNDEGNTLIVPLPGAVPQADVIQVTPMGAANIDVSGLTGNAAQNVDVTGVCLTSGAGTVDKPDSDLIVATLRQYSASYQGAAISTIDAINNSAQRFLGGATICNAGTILINDTNRVGGNTLWAPKFKAGDNLFITLSGANAFDGVNNVIFRGALGKATKAVGAATNQKLFTVTAATMLGIINANVGNNNVDVQLEVLLGVAGNTQLSPRTIAASALTLNLGATGNGAIAYGNYGNVLNWRQNGTLFRANYFRNDASGDNNQWYKFTNTSGAAVNIELRYFSPDGTVVTQWYQNPTAIPDNGVLTISKASVDNLVPEVVVGTSGWLEFRVHTAIDNTTAIINGKMNGSFFNIPMYYYDSVNGLWR